MHERDYNAVFFGKVLLNYALKKEQYIFDWANFVQDSNEKPFFSDVDFHFNISHSGDYIAVVLHHSPVGIDIEKHRNIHIDLFRKQFTDAEWKQIRNSDDEKLQFFQFWSAKEAAIKANGRGMEVLSKTKIISENLIEINEKQWYYLPFNLLSNYSFSVCTGQGFEYDEKDIIRLEATSLLK